MFELLAALVIVALASARLWRLVAVDEILETPRESVLQRLPDWVTKMVECPWCLGTQISVALWVIWCLWDPTHLPIAALSVAHVTGLIGER